MVAATLVMMPLAQTKWPAAPVSTEAGGATVLLAVFCTGAAYLIFFFSIDRQRRPTGVVSVTFLVLVCGVIWSAWFLDETITLFILGGGQHHPGRHLDGT